MSASLPKLLDDLADAVRELDCSLPPHKSFQAGIGPYGEPQLAKCLVQWLASQGGEYVGACTKREPDMLVPGYWAIEIKLARPFGDNGREAEHWSQNLLHPYEGNVSALSDALKLRRRTGTERKVVLVLGFEHAKAKVDLTPLLASFECIAKEVLHIRLSNREERRVTGLRHPEHQVCRLAAWEVL